MTSDHLDHSAARIPSRWAISITVTAFCLSRVALLLFLQPAGTDIPYYYVHAVKAVDFEKVPYKDYVVEYPPLALWLITVPAHLDGGKVTRGHVRAKKEYEFLPGYAFTFKLIMFVCDLGAFWLFFSTLRRTAPQRLITAALTYIIATTILGNVLYDRLDAGLLLGLMAWVYAWSRSSKEDSPDGCASLLWLSLAYLAVGASIAFKLIPIIIVPFLLLAEFRAATGRWKRLTVAAGCLALPTILSVIPLLQLSVGWEALKFLDYHRARGIEIESSYATVLFVLQQCGLELATEQSYGGWNVVSSLSMTMARASLILLLVSLTAVAVWSIRQGSAFTRRTALNTSCSAILLAVALSKVLSVQYLIWATPLALLVGAQCLDDRQWRWTIGLCVAILVLSTAVFPYLFFDSFYFQGTKFQNPFPLVPKLHWVPQIVLIVRNGLYGLVVFVVMRSAMRGDKLSHTKAQRHEEG